MGFFLSVWILILKGFILDQRNQSCYTKLSAQTATWWQPTRQSQGVLDTHTAPHCLGAWDACCQGVWLIQGSGPYSAHLQPTWLYIQWASQMWSSIHIHSVIFKDELPHFRQWADHQCTPWCICAVLAPWTIPQKMHGMKSSHQKFPITSFTSNPTKLIYFSTEKKKSRPEDHSPQQATYFRNLFLWFYFLLLSFIYRMWEKAFCLDTDSISS